MKRLCAWEDGIADVCQSCYAAVNSKFARPLECLRASVNHNGPPRPSPAEEIGQQAVARALNRDSGRGDIMGVFLTTAGDYVHAVAPYKLCGPWQPTVADRTLASDTPRSLVEVSVYGKERFFRWVAAAPPEGPGSAIVIWLGAAAASGALIGAGLVWLLVH